MNKINNQHQQGIIVLSAVLVMSVVILSVALFAGKFALSELNVNFSEVQSTQAFYAAESCAQEALYRLSKSNYTSYAGIGNCSNSCSSASCSGDPLTVGTQSCYVRVTSSGNSYTISAINKTSVSNPHTKCINITLGVAESAIEGENNTLTINSWQEQ